MSQVDWVANLGEGGPVEVWLHRRKVPMTPTRLTGAADATARTEAFARWPIAEKYERISGGRPVPFFEPVPRQATFARFTSSRSAVSSAWRFRQAM